MRKILIVLFIIFGSVNSSFSAGTGSDSKSESKYDQAVKLIKTAKKYEKRVKLKKPKKDMKEQKNY